MLCFSNVVWLWSKNRLLKAAGAEPLGRGELCGILFCILSNIFCGCSLSYIVRFSHVQFYLEFRAYRAGVVVSELTGVQPCPFGFGARDRAQV